MSIHPFILTTAPGLGEKSSSSARASDQTAHRIASRAPPWRPHRRIAPRPILRPRHKLSPCHAPSTLPARQGVTRRHANANGLQEQRPFFCKHVVSRRRRATTQMTIEQDTRSVSDTRTLFFARDKAAGGRRRRHAALRSMMGRAVDALMRCRGSAARSTFLSTRQSLSGLTMPHHAVLCCAVLIAVSCAPRGSGWPGRLTLPLVPTTTCLHLHQQKKSSPQKPMHPRTQPIRRLPCISAPLPLTRSPALAKSALALALHRLFTSMVHQHGPVYEHTDCKAFRLSTLLTRHRQ